VRPGKERLVGGWLFLSAAGVLGMIVLGGYTRLTHSGLSMADWSPYTKRFPRNAEEWEVEFDKYRKTIEYQTVNKDIDLEKFKPIYWVEFFHRQMGMVLGYWFIIPFAIFQYKGYLQPKMRNRMLALLGLGGLQGGIGWWMVKSGLKEKPEYQNRPRVSPYRLAAHLGMATTLYSGLLWNSFSLLIKPT
jgi:cytochrome c oxidase assembly protein subunit 15